EIAYPVAKCVELARRAVVGELLLREHLEKPSRNLCALLGVGSLAIPVDSLAVRGESGDHASDRLDVGWHADTIEAPFPRLKAQCGRQRDDRDHQQRSACTPD